MADDCDILIVGGGPAGLAAAETAARQGVRIIVLERQYEIGKNSRAKTRGCKHLNKERWHFMGIGGQGISAVAQMVLEARGNNVVITGCDMQASATTRARASSSLSACSSTSSSEAASRAVKRSPTVPSSGTTSRSPLLTSSSLHVIPNAVEGFTGVTFRSAGRAGAGSGAGTGRRPPPGPARGPGRFPIGPAGRDRRPDGGPAAPRPRASVGRR